MNQEPAVEALLGEHEEAVAAQAELAAALGTPALTSAGGADLADDDALLEELGQLTAPRKEEEAPPPLPAREQDEMPAAPTAPPRIGAQAAAQAAAAERQAVLA